MEKLVVIRLGKLESYLNLFTATERVCASSCRHRRWVPWIPDEVKVPFIDIHSLIHRELWPLWGCSSIKRWPGQWGEVGFSSTKSEMEHSSFLTTAFIYCKTSQGEEEVHFCFGFTGLELHCKKNKKNLSSQILENKWVLGIAYT